MKRSKRIFAIIFVAAALLICLPPITRGAPSQDDVLKSISDSVAHGDSSAHAAPSQDEVLKSISDNINMDVDPRKVLAIAIAFVGFVIAIVVLNQYVGRPSKPKSTNHPGKLLKEVAKSMQLRPAEMKMLRMLAADQNLDSPLSLMLCPSVLAKAVKDRGGKVDRETINSIARKIVPQGQRTK